MVVVRFVRGFAVDVVEAIVGNAAVVPGNVRVLVAVAGAATADVRPSVG